MGQNESIESRTSNKFRVLTHLCHHLHVLGTWIYNPGECARTFTRLRNIWVTRLAAKFACDFLWKGCLGSRRHVLKQQFHILKRVQLITPEDTLGPEAREQEGIAIAQPCENEGRVLTGCIISIATGIKTADSSEG